MKNKQNILTRGFSPLLILIILLLIIPNLLGQAYWHNIWDSSYGTTTVNYNVVGDSSTLYSGMYFDNKAMILRSKNLGRTWDTVYHQKEFNWPPYKDFEGMKYPAPGYMFLLYSHNESSVPDGHIKAGTSIKRFDERIGKVVDSIVIDTNSGNTKDNLFTMYDSLNGLCLAYGIAITRDGWKTYTKLKYKTNYKQWMFIPQMLSPDTVFCKSHNPDVDYIEGFYLALIGKGDSSITYEELGKGITIEITDDSTHTITNESEIFYKRASSYAYINDSTWLYTAPGKKTGYGQCTTLEIFKTTNRGKTYRQVCNMSIQAFGVDRIYFKDELNGIAVGNDTSLFTDDGGETWTIDKKAYDNDWNYISGGAFWNPRISYVDGMTFMTVFAMGIYKFEEVFGTMDTVGIAKRPFINNSLLYPNPIQAGKTLNFKIPQLISGNVFIYDIYGNKIQDSNFFGNSIQLRNDISPGTYFLVIGDVNEKIIMRSKFIVR